MNDSSKHSKPEQLREATAPTGLELPVAPDWFSDEPAASWEVGYELSLIALRDALKRPEIWEARERERVHAEFIWDESP